MPITYGLNMSRLGMVPPSGHTVLKEYAIHTEKSDVFLSYRSPARCITEELAAFLNNQGATVYMDVHDDFLNPGDSDLDLALLTAIKNSCTMVIVISDETLRSWWAGSWWVPWEIGVSTPYGIPRALYGPRLTDSLPTYLVKLPRLNGLQAANQWILDNKSRRRPQMRLRRRLNRGRGFFPR